MLVFPTSGLGLLSLPHPSSDVPVCVSQVGIHFLLLPATSSGGGSGGLHWPEELWALLLHPLSLAALYWGGTVLPTSGHWVLPAHMTCSSWRRAFPGVHQKPEPTQVSWTKDRSEGGECRAVSGPSWCLEATHVPQRPKGVSWNRWLSGCPKSEPH